MTDIPTETIYITSILDTWASFAITASTREGVYVPASVAKAVQVQIGGAYQAVLVPNDADRAHDTPWRLVKIVPQGEDGFADVIDALSKYDCPIEAQHLTVSPGRLEKAWRKGKIVRVEAKQSPHAEPVILWAHSMEVV